MEPQNNHIAKQTHSSVAYLFDFEVKAAISELIPVMLVSAVAFYRIFMYLVPKNNRVDAAVRQVMHETEYRVTTIWHSCQHL